MITVLVGPPQERKELQIHRGIITARSEFFANALSGRWSDSINNVIDIYKFDPDINPQDFQRYLEKVYTKEYSDDCKKSDPDAYIKNLCLVYVIAEAMLDRQTRNVLARALYDHSTTLQDNDQYYCPDVPSIHIIYNGTASSSNLMRRLCENFWYDDAEPAWFADDVPPLPHEFLKKLVLKDFSRPKLLGAPVTYDIEEYMEPEEGDGAK
jgi:hypothetical protein